MTRKFACERGQGLVEFAMVLPVFLLLAFGVVAGMLALMILAGLMTSVALLAITAFVALRRRTGERAMSG